MTNKNGMEDEDGPVPEFLGENWHFSMAYSPWHPQPFSMPWLPHIGKGIHALCIVSPCLAFPLACYPWDSLLNSKRVDLCADSRGSKGRRERGMDVFSHPAHYGDEGAQRGMERMFGSGLGGLNSGTCSVTNPAR